MIQRQAFAADDSAGQITFIPIEHASFVIQSDQLTIYVDPVGDPAHFADFAQPDLILITDIHHDHLDSKLVKRLAQENTIVLGPKEVIEQLGFGEIISNGQSNTYKTVNIAAIPMYNLTPQRLKFHEKGRGNGYLLTLNNQRIYVSGDTEDIPEMRGLKNIDYALVCMNLPYTMSVEQAASAVLAFKPKVVFPYHYRGTGGASDIKKFRELVAVNKEIKVRFLKWY
ncbi:MBL fold metallo-hydrolase [Candidatus Omnitrophota bacterium]